MSSPTIVHVNRLRLVILSALAFALNKYVFHADISAYIFGYFFAIYIVDYIMFNIGSKNKNGKYNNYSGILGSIFSIIIFVINLLPEYHDIYVFFVLTAVIMFDILFHLYFLSKKSVDESHQG